LSGQATSVGIAINRSGEFESVSR